MSLAATVNGAQITSGRLTFSWRGAWMCDAEIDPDILASLPPLTGPATLVVGGLSLVGSFDPRGSASWTSKATARIVGGMGGWDKPVPALFFAGPATSTEVYAQAAGQVGETPPIDANPITYQQGFTQMAGAASQVFEDRDWYVDPTTGVTQIASWPTTTLNSGATIIDFEPYTQMVTVASDVAVLPGTVLSDSRFNGVSYTVRDAEHTFTHTGTIIRCWCSIAACSPLQSALVSAVRSFADTAHLKTYRYRFAFAPDTGDVALQAITPNAPDLNPLAQWEGLNGAAVTFAPSTEIVVGFTGDSPPQPYLITFSNAFTPIAVALKASQKYTVDAPTLTLGPSATGVDIAGGGGTLTPSAWATALASALSTFAGTIEALPPPTSLPTALTVIAGIITAATTLSTALGGLPPDATTKTKAT